MSVGRAPVDGVELAYHDRGTGHPVVFVHGGGSNQFCWWQQIPALSRSFACLAYDQRGHGLSADVGGGPGAEAWVDDLAGLLDHVGVEEVSIVGHSLGGWTATGFAAAHPERVASLVLVDSTGGVLDPEAALAALTDVGDGAADGAGDEPLLRGSAVDDGAAYLYELLASIHPPDASSGPGRAREIIEGFRRRGTPAPATVVDAGVPVAMLAGEHDALTPVDRLRRVRDRLGADPFVVVDGASHSPHVEQPAAFNEHLRAILGAAVG